MVDNHEIHEAARQAAREKIAQKHEANGRTVNAVAIRLGRFDHEADVRDALIGAEAALAAVRALILAEAARAQCGRCAEGAPFKYGRLHDVGNGCLVPCQAAAILALIPAQPAQEDAPR